MKIGDEYGEDIGNLIIACFLCFGQFILTNICRSNTDIFTAEQYWTNVRSFADSSIFVYVRVSWILAFLDTEFVFCKSDD